MTMTRVPEPSTASRTSVANPQGEKCGLFIKLDTGISPAPALACDPVRALKSFP